MDLGIRGKRAIVCAASKGLGRGCAEALAEAGVELVINARGREALEATAEAIRSRHGVEVAAVAADVTTAEGRAALLAACPEPDILVNNAGGPPPGLWSDWSREDFVRALDANMLAPIAMMQAVMPAMMARGWGRVVNITSGAVKAPIPQLGLSNAARAGLTGFVAGTSRQVAAKGVTINNLLPGIHATDRAIALDEGVAKASPRRGRGGRRRSRRGATAPRRSSAPPAPSCARSMRGSSSVRTSCWTAGRSTARCEAGPRGFDRAAPFRV
jgi:3-oxoacyl-[acyl-carrier protein] reductase